MAKHLSLSRRQLLQSAAVVSLGGLFAACKPQKVIETVVVKETVPVVQTKVTEKVVTPTPVTVKVAMEWLVPGLKGNPYTPPFQKVIDEFQAATSNVTLKMTDANWLQDREIILTRMISGDAPDLYWCHSNRVTEIGEVMQGFATFDSFTDFPTVSAWFPKARLEACRSRDGHYYAQPVCTLIFATAVNMAMLKEVGIKEPPKTLSQMRAAAKAVTIPGKRFGVGWPMGNGLDTAYRLYPYALKAGSRFLADDLKTATWNDEAGLATMQFMLDLKADGSFVPGADAWTGVEEWNAWKQKVFAFAIGGPWIPKVSWEGWENDVLLIKTPLPDAMTGKKPSGTLSDDIVVTITRQCKHKDLAWAFVKLFTDAKHSAMWLDPEMGGQPSNAACYKDPLWQKYWGHEIYEAEADVAVNWPYSTILSDLQNEYTLAVSQVWTGQKPLKAGFDEGAKRCSDLLAKVKV